MTTTHLDRRRGASTDVVPSSRRAISLVAVGTILLTTPALWAAATSVPLATQRGLPADPRLHAALLVVVVVGTGALLALGTAAAVARSARVLGLVDAGVLALAAVVTAGITLVVPTVSDEGVLTDRAATALLHGQPVYGAAWRSLFADGTIALTPTMSGGADYSYAYPPGGALLVAGFRAVFGHATAAPAVVGTAALIAAVAAAWLLTPAPFRSLVTAAGLGTAMLPADARAGYPAVIALALLVPAVAAWHRTGAGGLLGWRGLLRAGALGAACAVHQTAWFLALFLIVGVWALRRAEVGGGRALLTAVRYALVAAAVWLVVDLPSAIRQPTQWAHGILLPMTQHAIVHGQGLVAVTEFLLPGSGAIAWFGAAQLALLAALVVLLALRPHRLAIALPILPALPYLLGTRSSADYLVLLLPLWVLAALTVPSGLEGPAGRLRGRGTAIVTAALLVPALACAAVAVLTPSPLAIRMVGVAEAKGAVRTATVTVRNTDDVAIRPHFLSRVGTHPSFWWSELAGPSTVDPGRTARFVLRPDTATTGRLVAAAGARSVLMTTSDAPETLTTVRFPG